MSIFSNRAGVRHPPAGRVLRFPFGGVSVKMAGVVHNILSKTDLIHREDFQQIFVQAIDYQ